MFKRIDSFLDVFRKKEKEFTNVSRKPLVNLYSKDKVNTEFLTKLKKLCIEYKVQLKINIDLFKK